MPVNHLLPFALPTRPRRQHRPAHRLLLAPAQGCGPVLGDYPEWLDWPATLATG